MEKYWRKIEEIDSGPVKDELEKSDESQKDDFLGILEELPFKSQATRRDFLKIMSYSIAGTALLAACKKPIQKAIPYLIQPSDVIPGKASHYASTFYDGSEYCPVVVKVRDGRPIKLEGNNLYKYTNGGTSVRVQASILSLYDNARIKYPLHKNNQIDWNVADKEIISKLEKIQTSDKEIIILTSTLFSPSTLKVVDEFKSHFKKAKSIFYDGISYSGLIEAYHESSNFLGIPYPLFNKAEVVVSFGADFLGTWLLPTEFALAYVSKRKVEKGKNKMSRHIQYESNLSLTGSNADERIQIKPSEESTLLANLYNILCSKLGSIYSISVNPVSESFKLEKIAIELLSKKGLSIVISGSNDKQIQKIVIAINQLLENYGNTFEIEKPILLKQGIDIDIFNMIDDMQAGKIGAIFFNNVNPCYDYYESAKFIKALEIVDLKVSFSGLPNETVKYCDYVCPDNHFLESWNDFEPRTGIYSLAQPCIAPVFDTRQMQSSLLKWSGNNKPWQEYLEHLWEYDVFPKQHDINDFETFWIQSVRSGYIETNEKKQLKISEIHDFKITDKKEDPSNVFELQLIVSMSITSWYHSNNPWLQELPDPISRVTWDNYASISPKQLKELKLKTGDLISLDGFAVEIPVLEQPGQAYGVISVAMNYGRTMAGKVAAEVGVNVYPFIKRNSDNLQYYQTEINIRKVNKSVVLAQTQTHHTMEGRSIVRETTLTEYASKPNAGNEEHEEFEKTHQTLYPEKKYESFHWALGIDLNACIGCAACVIACQAENNISIVGKDQVIKRRIMHWIRVDRYYSGKSESPSVLYQPVTCQHCDNAPCENVCPVAATTHSNEGLNQMTYNRCVGTRYCLNNCPYKVRRFNWLKFADNPKFDFNQNSELGKMVLNPDVVVRERGVVEKCTFCVQRIQEKKLTAKLENRLIVDGEVQPACAQACPTKAMTFGDLNDMHSDILKIYSNERNYHLLEELHTLPKVGYLTKVRNM